ncbi:MAG: hypothetical protein Q7J51_13810 [Sheuella sp.]|nr:hypothetical protein [Sheuella sp.]
MINYRSLLALLLMLWITQPAVVRAEDSQRPDWDQGLSSYQRFIVYPHIEKAFTAIKNNHTDQAIQEFAQAHKLVPSQPQIAIYLANAYEDNQEFDLAIALLTRQVKNDPSRQDLQQALTQAQARLAHATLGQAQSLTANSTELLRFLTKNKPEFTEAYDEYGWIKLLAQVSSNANNLLLTYKPRFYQNEIFQIEEIIKFHLAGADQKSLTKYISKISQSLRSKPQQLDQVSYQLMEQGSYNQVIQLLLNAYPFPNADESSREVLLQRIYLAQASATDKTLLIAFTNKKPALKTAAEEKEWLELLAAAAPAEPKALLNYQCVFDSNKTIQAHLVLNQFQSSQSKVSARQLVKFLPHLNNLSTTQLDQVSFNLEKEGLPDQALDLLLNEYPFQDASPSLRHTLFDRLSLITAKSPNLLTQHDIAKLSTPLDTATMRSKQSELLEALKNCDSVERVLEDYSTEYDNDDWIRLGNCYQKQDTPGLAQFAYSRAYGKEANVKTARTLAYQAFTTKDFDTSLAMWKKVIDSREFKRSDLKAATYTAIASNQIKLATQWLKQYELKGGKQGDEYWWLKTITELETNPKQAMDDVQRAIAIQPKVEYYETLAALQTKQGNETGATASLKKALVLNADNSSVEASLGYAYYRQNKMVKADKYLDRALKMRPDDNSLIEQLAFTNQRLGQNDKALFFTKQAIDNDDLYTAAEITPEIQNQRFGLRRMHEDLQRRWTLSVDAISGNQIASVPNAPQPGLNYKSYGQAEIAYRLGDPAIDDGKTLSVFSRIFAGNGSQNASLPIYAPVLSAGLRWKPFSDQVINLSVEEQIPLDQGQSPPTNTLLRVSASFFNSGKYSDEWHPAAQGWLAQNLYLDAAYYVVNKLSSLTADYRLSYHNRLGESQTIEPYSHIQWNSLNQQTQPDVRAGLGVRWNIWGNESHYNAYASKISVGLEFQYAISTYLSDKSTVLLTFGGRW